jgi:hypothetical protein
MTLKDKLTDKLGVFGFILYLLLGFINLIVPCIMLKYAWWIKILVFVVIIAFQLLGSIVLYGAWVLSFINVLSLPVGFLSITYYVCFGIFVLTQFIPDMIQLIGSIIIGSNSKYY